MKRNRIESVTQELTERDAIILNKLLAEGSVGVSALSQELGVSEVTVRSDLSRLESLGRLSRTHGGAVPVIHPHVFERQNLNIAENSVMALETAKTNPDIRITVTGGEFRRSTDSFVGFIALETIRRFNVKMAFVGTDGFSVKSGITTHLLEGGEVIKTMRERSGKMILLSDSSKYEKTGVVSILPITSVDTIITDSGLSSDAVATVQEKSVQVIICED